MKSNWNRRQFQIRLFWGLIGIAIALFLSLPLTPAFARANPAAPTFFLAQQLSLDANSKAPIILDGRQLFQVSPAGDYPAEVRADLINTQLKLAARSSEPVQVTIEERNHLPTILLNQQYLLTVTRGDTSQGMTPEEQAKIWVAQIQRSLQQAQQERSGAFIREALLLAAFVVILAIALHQLLGHFWQHYLMLWLRRLIPDASASTSNRGFSLEILLNFSLASARIALWFITIYTISNFFPLTRSWNYRFRNEFLAIFTSPILTLNKEDYSATDILILIGLIVGLIVLSGRAANLLKSRVLQVTGINRGAQEAIAAIIKYIAIAIGTLVILQIWGLDISSLTIVASALGVGIGFGFQDIAKNFGSGLVLIFERRIQVGDFIQVGEYMGTVDRIGGRSTAIRSLDNISIIVPNSRFLETEVINWSHPNLVSRLSLPVHVAYGTNLHAVRETLLDAAKENPNVLLFPQPQVFFKGYGENTLNFDLLVWTEQPSQQYLLKSDLYFRIEELFQQRQIEIPFPQRDLHLRSGHLPIELSPQLEAMLWQLLERLTNENKGSSDSNAKQQRNNMNEN